jgi:hypothetical protein
MECCLFSPYKAETIAMYIMPELKTVWNEPDFFEFVNRRTYFGRWTQPDPCAPITGICSGGSNSGTPCTGQTLEYVREYATTARNSIQIIK